MLSRRENLAVVNGWRERASAESVSGSGFRASLYRGSVFIAVVAAIKGRVWPRSKTSVIGARFWIGLEPVLDRGIPFHVQNAWGADATLWRARRRGEVRRVTLASNENEATSAV